jgi:glycerophosphoryl diester phosphodiesterase
MNHEIKPKSLIIAHRGSRLRAPENTLKAFDLAIKEKAHGIELDVWKCASGEPVVTHNNELAPLTGRDGRVERSSLTQLKQLDFGEGEKIPTLDEVLDLVTGMELLNVEIKGTRLFSNGIEADVFRALRQRNLLEKTVVSSFNPLILFRLKRLSPHMRLGLLFHRASALPFRRAWPAYFLKPPFLHPEYPLLTEGLMARAKRKKQKVIAWTINNIDDLDKCIALGVHAIITDDPPWALNHLARR